MERAPDRRGIGVDLNDPLAGKELAVIGGPLRQAGAEGDDAIGLGNRLVTRRRAERATQVDRIRLVLKQPLGLQRGRQRRLKPVGQPDQRITRSNGPLACEDERTLGRGDHADGVVKHIAFGRIGRGVENRMDGALIPRLLPHELGRHVQDHRAMLGAGAVKRPGQILKRRTGRAQLFEPRATERRNRALVCILQMCGAGDRRIAGQNHQPDLGAGGIRQGGDAIGQRRAMGHGRHADLAADLGIALRHEHRAAFMDGGDKARVVQVLECINQEQVGVTNEAKEPVDPMIGEAAGQ